MCCCFALFRQKLESNFVNHIFLFLFGRIVTHRPHQIRNFLYRDLSIELSRFSCIFLFRPDHRVVEEVIHVLEGLPFPSTFDQIYKWLNPCAARLDS